MPEAPHRQRARKACQPCRDRKRKCDGNLPCATCERFEYECFYRTQPSLRLHNAGAGATASPQVSNKSTPYHSDHEPEQAANHDAAVQLRPLEANSGAVFARSLGLGSSNGESRLSQIRLVAWNLGLRSATSSRWFDVRPMTALISRVHLKELASVYFSEVHPVFGFLDRQWFDIYVAYRWASVEEDDMSHDAIFCGVAALGCLFSGGPSDLEEQLCRSATMALEPSGMQPQPRAKDVVGWLLRVIYLRLTAPPHAGWIAIGTMMHVLEAAGLHLECPEDNQSPEMEPGSPESIQSRRRVYCIARYLNNWISFDHGRLRIEIPDSTTLLPDADESFCTGELLQLYVASEILAPGHNKTSVELEDTLHQLSMINPTQPMMILIQCNAIFCIYRRLRALGARSITSRHDDQVQAFAAKALDAAVELLEYRKPWWHMPNMTFQSICALLVIDTPKSLQTLGMAVKVLYRIQNQYRTETMDEASSAAWELVYLHRKRKEQDLAVLDDVLCSSPLTSRESSQPTPDPSSFYAANPALVSNSGWEQFLNMDFLPR